MTQLMSVRAVVVGIDDYKDPRLLTRKLKYAATDAYDVARAIDQSTAFKVEKLAIFTNVHATHRQVWHSLNEVFPPHLNFDSNTIAIFYFAGHGMKDPIEGERIYLGCNDVEVANPMKGGIPLSNIYNLLLQSSAGCSMAIIDACFSGAIMDLKRIEHESPAELARREIGTLRGADDKTVAIFAACRSEQSAREDDERKHGIYTDELLQGWRDGKARDEEGKVHILDLAAYLTKLFENDEQTPRSNVLSGRSIVIWQHDPPASGTVLTLPKPLPPRKLTDVGDRIIIPTAPPEEEPKTWRERLLEWAKWIIRIDQWGQPVQQPQQGGRSPSFQEFLPSTPPGGNAPWQQQAPGGVGATPLGGAQVPSSNLAREYLQFTAFHSRVVPTATWSTLLVYAYIESALQAIRADAAKFKDELGSSPSEVNVWTSRPVTRDTQITIVPVCHGITFNPQRASFTWVEDWQQVKFRFQADRILASSTCNGEIIIYAGPLIIATLKMSLRFVEQSSSPSIENGKNIAEVSAYLYKQIFASYSHIDTPIVLACRNVYKALGFDNLIDIDNLRSGQRWDVALLKMIDTADIFQLFWSANSARSPFVRKEWQYALQHSKDEGFIRPVYWEKPLVPPPSELLHIQFAYIELPRLETAVTRSEVRPHEVLLGILRIEEGKDCGSVFEVHKESLSIGRSRESDIFLQDQEVSLLHASIINLGNNNYALRDEGSANGTRVNGQLVYKYQPFPLQEGDKIQLGQTVLIFFKQ